MNKKRCTWCKDDPLYVAYHDKEWGVPIRDEKLLFEFLVLEGMQAGLSWLTILKKRDTFRLAFANFDAEKIAKFDQKKVDSLLNNPGIIRNKLKIISAVENAKVFLSLKEDGNNFSDYIWHFVDNNPIQNHWQTGSRIPAKTILSDAMSKDLKKRGFKFVGSTICYAFMQAVGMVNDHIIDCFRYKEINNKT